MAAAAADAEAFASSTSPSSTSIVFEALGVATPTELDELVTMLMAVLRQTYLALACGLNSGAVGFKEDWEALGVENLLFDCMTLVGAYKPLVPQIWWEFVVHTML